MSSLINKQLLLTAYAYLFIMEQQKEQQGSEALQGGQQPQREQSVWKKWFSCCYAKKNTRDGGSKEGTGPEVGTTAKHKVEKGIQQAASASVAEAKQQQEHAAVTKIQAAVRGWQTCRQLKELKEELKELLADWRKLAEKDQKAFPYDPKTVESLEGQIESVKLAIAGEQGGWAKSLRELKSNNWQKGVAKLARRMQDYAKCVLDSGIGRDVSKEKFVSEVQSLLQTQIPKKKPKEEDYSWEARQLANNCSFDYAPKKESSPIKLPDINLEMIDKIIELKRKEIPAMFILKDSDELLHNENVRHNRRVLCRLLLASSSVFSASAVCKAAAKLEGLLKTKAPSSEEGTRQTECFVAASRDASIFDRETDMVLQKFFVDGHSSQRSPADPVVNGGGIAAGVSPGSQLLHDLGGLPESDENILSKSREFASSYTLIWPEIEKLHNDNLIGVEPGSSGKMAAARVFAVSVFYFWQLTISPERVEQIDIPVLIWMAMKQILVYPIKSKRLGKILKIPQTTFPNTEMKWFFQITDLVAAAELSGSGGDRKLQVAMLKVIAYLADPQQTRSGSTKIDGLDFSELLRKSLIRIAPFYLPRSV